MSNDQARHEGVRNFVCQGRFKKILVQAIGEALTEQQGELVDGLLRRHRRHPPVFLDIAQGQIWQFAGGFVAREV